MSGVLFYILKRNYTSYYTYWSFMYIICIHNRFKTNYDSLYYSVCVVDYNLSSLMRISISYYTS